jgi:hypothetical protein
MMFSALFLLLLVGGEAQAQQRAASNNVDLDIVTLPLSGDIRVALAPAGRTDFRREGTVSHVRIDIDRVNPPSTLMPGMNTYIVWAVSAEGILDNLGELDLNGTKGQFSGTTRLGEFGVLITAEPHYMVDRPSSAVAFRTQTPQEIRRKTVPIPVGAYDYSKLTPISAVGVHGSVTQARTAFQIAKSLDAEHLAPAEFRNAQVAMGALEELVMRAAPLDLVWPKANEAIRWSERSVEIARGKN